MRRLLLFAAVLLALSGVAQASAPTSSFSTTARKPVLISMSAERSSRVFFADPVSLRARVGRSLRVPFNWAATLGAPDGSFVALASNDAPEVRFVHLPELRVTGTLRFSDSQFVWPLAWPSRHVLIARLESPIPRVLGIDPTVPKVLWRRPLAGQVRMVERSADGVVLLVSDADTIAPARLVAVSSTGTVRSVVLDRILAGLDVDENLAEPAARQRSPGLAIDRVGNRAFVVGAGEPVAEVDLPSMTVRYHDVFRTFAKVVSGPQRRAAWIGDGLLAVAGSDSSVTVDAQGRFHQTTTPSGLVLIDTRTWATRSVQADATDVAVVGRWIMAFGSHWDSASSDPIGSGVTIYSGDGTPRVHLAERRPVWQVRAQNGLAYAFSAGRPSRIYVIDVSAGRLLATVSRAVNVLFTR